MDRRQGAWRGLLLLPAGPVRLILEEAPLSARRGRGFLPGRTAPRSCICLVRPPLSSYRNVRELWVERGVQARGVRALRSGPAWPRPRPQPPALCLPRLPSLDAARLCGKWTPSCFLVPPADTQDRSWNCKLKRHGGVFSRLCFRRDALVECIQTGRPGDALAS